MQSKLLRATLASFAAMLMLSFAWYGFIAKTYHDEEFMMVLRSAEDFSIAGIAVGYLLLALLLSYAYPYGYTGGRSGSQGMRFGVLMGLLIALPAAFISSGAYKFPLAASLVDAAYRTLEVGLAGLIIGRIYGVEATGTVSS